MSAKRDKEFDEIRDSLVLAMEKNSAKSREAAKRSVKEQGHDARVKNADPAERSLNKNTSHASKAKAARSASKSKQKTQDESTVRLSGPVAQNIAVCGLAFAIVLLSLMGTGMITLSCLLGIALCIIGCLQRSIKVDWWIFGPLLVFMVFNFLSSFSTYGNLVRGFASFQLIYVVLYALIGCLNVKRTLLLKKLCVLWVALVAASGIFEFTVDSFSSTASRLNVLFGNANAVGIFMVLGWFALLNCRIQDHQDEYFPNIKELIFRKPASVKEDRSGKTNAQEKPSRKEKRSAPPVKMKMADRLYGILTWVLPFTEPIILVALLLTLSMGSIVSLLIGLIVYMLWKKHTHPEYGWPNLFNQLVFFGAKIVVCFLVGLFMYLAAERAGMPLMCEILFLYLVVLVLSWHKLENFLATHKAVSILLSVGSILCAVVAIILRPNALNTFFERFAMMGNGLHYLLTDPLLGVGPNQWRFYNLQDPDTYFNVWHIHNLFIHMGVEIGLVALIALIIIAVRCFMKRAPQAQQGENAAFLFHLFIDTAFFVLGVVSLFIMTAGDPTRRGRFLKTTGTKVFFIIVGFLYLDILLVSVQIF